MVLKASNLQSSDDFQGKVVGVLKGNPEGSVFETYIQNTYPGQFQIQQYNSIDAIVGALSNKDIIAAYMHRSSVVYWEENGGGVFTSLGPVTTIGKGTAIMSLPKNTLLIQRINQLIQTMETNNSYLYLYNTYFGDD